MFFLYKLGFRASQFLKEINKWLKCNLLPSIDPSIRGAAGSSERFVEKSARQASRLARSIPAQRHKMMNPEQRWLLCRDVPRRVSLEMLLKTLNRLLTWKVSISGSRMRADFAEVKSGCKIGFWFWYWETLPYAFPQVAHLPCPPGLPGFQQTEAGRGYSFRHLAYKSASKERW